MGVNAGERGGRAAGARYDLVIVGGGAAGLACAARAVERGARVALLEKASELGGTLAVSAGQMSAAGTRRQAERGIDDGPERHAQEILARSGEVVDHALVRLATAEAAATVDWLEDLGLALDPATPRSSQSHEAYATPRTYWPAAGGGGRAIRDVLVRALEPALADGRCELLLGTRAETLVVEEGRVVGVRASRDGADAAAGGGAAAGDEAAAARGDAAAGDGVELRSAAVVLASGGYAADPELYAELSPQQPRLVSNAHRTSTGDGLRMARALGAATRGGEHQLQTVGVIEHEPGEGRDGGRVDWIELSPKRRAPLELHVNARGERFLAEDDPSPYRRELAVMAQPGQRCWVIFDEAALGADPFTPVLNAEQIRERAAGGDASSRADARGERAEAGRGAIVSAETIERLAVLAGIDRAGLVATVAAWNGAVLDGIDPLGRERPAPALDHPPYYAVAVHAAAVLSFGGVRCDERLRPLRPDGSAIDGLHVAGEIVGAAALSGSFFHGGMAVTPALAFGRLLGERLTAR